MRKLKRRHYGCHVAMHASGCMFRRYHLRGNAEQRKVSWISQVIKEG